MKVRGLRSSQAKKIKKTARYRLGARAAAPGQVGSSHVPHGSSRGLWSDAGMGWTGQNGGGVRKCHGRWAASVSVWSCVARRPIQGRHHRRHYARRRTSGAGVVATKRGDGQRSQSERRGSGAGRRCWGSADGGEELETCGERERGRKNKQVLISSSLSKSPH